MQYFPNLKQGDPINRRWFNDLIGFCNSLVLRGDGRTTRVNRTASGTTVSTIPQPVTAGGGGGASFRNFAMSPDAAGTGVVIGEGYYYLSSAGARSIMYQASAAISAANMPPADGKLYFYCLGMNGAPPWIGGTLDTFPGWAGTYGGTAPAGLDPIMIGAVLMTTPVQVFQPPLIGVPTTHAAPSDNFAVYAVYGGQSFPQTAYSSFAAVPPNYIHVNGGWCPYVTYYNDNDTPPQDTWHFISGKNFSMSSFSSTQMVCVEMGPYTSGASIVLRNTFSSGTQFTSFVWDYDTKKAIVPIAKVSYNPSTAGLSIEQYNTGIVYAVPLYNP